MSSVLLSAKAVAEEKKMKIVTDAIAAADWIATALLSSGYHVDFTLDGLSEIDRFFDDSSSNGIAKPGGLLSEQLGSRMFALGSYVGETLRRQIGGEWVGDDSDPQAEINLALRLVDGSTVWPVQRVMKRLRNGKEDSIAAYGAALSDSRK